MCKVFGQALNEIRDENINNEVNLVADDRVPVMMERLRKLGTSEIVETDEVSQTTPQKEKNKTKKN